MRIDRIRIWLSPSFICLMSTPYRQKLQVQLIIEKCTLQSVLLHLILHSDYLSMLSVIIPAYNEEKSVGKILNRLSQIRLLNDMAMELIVVNDSSTDRTEEMVLAYMQDNPAVNVQYFKHD